MILQALNQYYKRLNEESEADIPLKGFSRQRIHFALLIDSEGNLLGTPDLRKMQGNRAIPKELTVPEPVKRTVAVEPNFMWDNTGYVLGLELKEDTERSRKSFDAFCTFHNLLGRNVRDVGMTAVLRFLEKWSPERVKEIPIWEEMAGKNVVFQLDGVLGFVHERPSIQDAWLKYVEEKSSDVTSTCLVSGEKAPIARLHPDIKGVRGRGAQPKGASIVSFNLGAFESYGKTQNFNAPVSERIAFNYTTALNYLLRYDSRQKAQIGDTTTVFWTERESPVEGFMGIILNPAEDAGDTLNIRLFLEAVRDGKKPADIGDPDVKFYILGLSPNAARISVRFWHVSTVGDIVEKIGQHFKDLSIIKRFDSDSEFPSLWQIMRETAVRRDPNNIHPLLAGAIMRAVLTGTNYPQTLLTAILSRIRAEQDINYLRAAIIKACLIRHYRINNISKEVGMSLDRETTNVAYRLGRLFAVLEKVQLDAAAPAKLNTTIKDRFYGAASATPSTVFPQLLRLAQHHIQKAEFGRHNDRMIEEIMQDVKEFPAHLVLDEQGMFAIGYYHQRQAFYLKNTNQEEEKL